MEFGTYRKKNGVRRYMSLHQGVEHSYSSESLWDKEKIQSDCGFSNMLASMMLLYFPNSRTDVHMQENYQFKILHGTHTLHWIGNALDFSTDKYDSGGADRAQRKKHVYILSGINWRSL